MSTIDIRIEDAVALLTLNRPDKRNAINDEMREEMTAAFERFAAEAAIRVVVLTGAGPAFCAGGDLTMAMPPDPQRPRIVESLDRFEKPVIAAINGLAFGGGLERARVRSAHRRTSRALRLPRSVSAASPAAAVRSGSRPW